MRERRYAPDSHKAFDMHEVTPILMPSGGQLAMEPESLDLFRSEPQDRIPEDRQQWKPCPHRLVVLGLWGQLIGALEGETDCIGAKPARDC